MNSARTRTALTGPLADLPANLIPELHEVALGLIGRLDLFDLLQAIVKRAAALARLSDGFIYLLENEGTVMTLRAATGDYFQNRLGLQVRPGEGIGGKVWVSKEPLLIEDYCSWGGRLPGPFYKMHAILGLPLKAGPNLVGVLVLASPDSAYQFEPQIINLLNQFIQLASVALDNAWLYHLTQQELAERKRVEAALRESEERHRLLFIAAQRQSTELALLDRIRTVLAQELALPILFKSVVEAISQSFAYTHVSLYLLYDEVLILQHQIGYDQVFTRIPLSKGISGRVVRSGKPLFVEEAQADADFLAAVDGITSEICVPLFEQGRAIGTLNIESTGGQKLTEADLRLMLSIAEHLGLAIRRSRLLDNLRESEQKYRLVSDNIKEVIFHADESGRWTFLNPAWSDLTGYTLQESLGKSFLSYIHPDDRQRNAELMSALVERSQPDCQHEVRYLTKEGDFCWLEMYTRLHLDSHHNIVGIFGTLHDVTQRKQAEEEIRKNLERERELNELKSRFVAMTSHEFRTPLSVVLSSAELLEHYGSRWAADKQLDHLHRIQTAVKNMTGILNDILTIGKAEAGKLEFNPAPLDLTKFCIELAEELQLDRHRQHTISFSYQGKAATVFMDEKLLRHILGNLLSNALKYSPTGSRVDFKLDFEPQKVLFEIKDCGIGIPVADQHRLFEAFHRAKNVGNISGTGLGLAIVKKALDLHGGTISLESKEGAGSTFTLSIPLPAKNGDIANEEDSSN